MAEANRPLRIFVASLGDCAAEREVVRRVATQDTTIQALCRKMGTSIDVFGWEDLPPDIGRSQSHINNDRYTVLWESSHDGLVAWPGL